MQSDYTFRVAALRIAEQRSPAGNVWRYAFAWKSPAYDGRLGAAHFVDVPFSFKMLSSEQAKTFVGDNPPAALADAMHSAWAAFARTGDPGWPVYDPAERPVMRFDTRSGVVNDPDEATRMIWRDIPL